jgi:hypothetical protein
MVHNFWSSLDWPNIIVGVLVTGIFGILTTKVAIPLINKWHQTSKLILHKRQKAAVMRDMRKIMKFRADQQSAVIWGVEKISNIVVGIFFLTLMVAFVLVSATAMGFRASLNWPGGDLGLVVTLAAGIGTVFAVVRIELAEIARISKYYNHFIEFKLQASEILTADEMSEFVEPEKVASVLD